MSFKYGKILIDVSNVYWAGVFVTPEEKVQLPSGEKIVTGGIYTFLRSIQKWRRELLAHGGRIYFLFDNAFSVENHRKVLDPEYKANRYKKEPLFYRGLDFLNLILLSYLDGWYCVKNPGSEADDLVLPFLKDLLPEEKVLLISGDGDWARGMSDQVHWFDFSAKQLLTPEDFELREGYYPSTNSICLFKAIHGETGDNIQNAVPYLPKEALLYLVRTCKTPERLFRKLEDGSLPEEEVSKAWQAKLLEAKARILLNWRLVSFQELSEETVSSAVTETRYEPEVLKRYYHLLGFNVEKIDPREELWPKKPSDDPGGFFQAEKIRRA